MSQTPARRAQTLRRPRSLRTKLTVAVVALLTLMTLALGFFTYTLMERSLTRQVDERLQESVSRVQHFREKPKDHDDDAGAQPANPLDAPGQGPGTLNVQITGSTVSTAQILDPKTGEKKTLDAQDQAELTTVPVASTPSTVSLSLGDYRVRAITLDNGQTLVTGVPLADAQRSLRNLTIIVLGVGVGTVALAAIGAALLIRRELRPLEKVAAVAQEVSEMPLDAGEVTLAARVTEKDAQPGSEAGAVGHALNQLLDSVESALESRQASEMKVRQFVADASHELRNPLAAIRGYADLLAATEHFSEDGYRSLGRVQAQSQRMSALVEDLLLLARLDEGRTPTMAEVDLTRMVLETVNDFRVAAPDHRWSIDVAEPISTRGDERQLQQILTNLLSNARKHTAPGTQVTAGVAREGDHAVLFVEDSGEGIDPAFLPHIFERFTRADAARSGSDGTTGLGLSIVDAIAASHGGSVSVESRPGRTRFEVRLPAIR